MPPTDVGRPTGTVTFLFTDIEGSTARWERDHTSMSTALAAHDQLLLSTIRDHGGYVFAAGGDGFAAAFADASAAVVAAMEAREALTIPVRMGVHTGTADERDGNYYGTAVNRAARVAAAGHGGQILLSDATASLVREHTELRDLGEHRLAGVGVAIRLWQVGREEHPVLRTVIRRRGNLARPLDVFVGRADEVATLLDLVDRHRLVSVVGVGGMGKTRLVVEALGRSPQEPDGGVWFVDLARARSDQAIVDEVASALDVQPRQGQTIEDRIVEQLEPRTAVLVFDNCEHVMRASAALIERLLAASPRLRVVATSREALMLRGEHVMPLGPLPADLERTGEGDAVALFVERASAEQHAFAPDDAELEIIGEICRRLDGMPLAIELAAARVRSLGTTGVRDHLDERLRLLSGGWRTGVGRQQTLQATLDWSYALLAPHEQAVLDRLGVFVGSFTIDDAIVVAADEGLHELDVIDAMSGLVDKSMCAADTTGSVTHYRYLETVRAYARAHLHEATTLVRYGTRHCAHFGERASRAVLAWTGPAEAEALGEMERSMAELRAAFVWAVDHDLADPIDSFARLAIPLMMRGSLDLGRLFYDARDQLTASQPARAVDIVYVALTVEDVAETRRLAAELLADDDPLAHVAPWTNLGWAHVMDGHYEEAIACQERFYELSEQLDDDWSHVYGAWPLAVTLALVGRDPGRLPHQVLERATALGFQTGIALGWYAVALTRDDPALGLEDFACGLAAAEAARNPWAQALIRRDRGDLAMKVLPPTQLAGEMLDLLAAFEGRSIELVNVLHRAAELLHRCGRTGPAATIYGWLNGRSFRTQMATASLAHEMDAAATTFGDDWDRLTRRGRAMDLDAVVAFTCEELATVA